jgi:GDP-4-dehydro-6-deoxy-D-mannose reductase
MSVFRSRVARVTGAAGFAGAHVSRALTERGARVHGLGSEPPRGPLALEGWHAADVRDPAAIESVLTTVKPDLVVHLAGQASAGRSFEHPVETFQINALGVWNLLDAVRRASPGARVLVVGTGEIYGPQAEGSLVVEDAPMRPVSPYALSKAAADAFAEVAFRTHGVHVVRTRSFAHAGPGQDARFAVPSWAHQIAAIEAGRAEPVIRVGNVDVVRDLTDVRDVAHAYLALLEVGRPGHAYNVCRGEGVRLRDVLARLVSRARVPVRTEVDASRLRAADVPYLVGDPTRIRHETGWQPSIALEQTLDDLLADARAAGEGAAPPASR